MSQTDEETPLLRSQQGPVKRTPLPWFQIFIVLFLQLAEPLTSQVIYPFLPQVRAITNFRIVFTQYNEQLVREIGITHGDEAAVGHYVGLLVLQYNSCFCATCYSRVFPQQSLFFLTQAMTVLHWSRLSDLVGRKPVILVGLIGLSTSMYCFGLSKTFWGLVLRYVSKALRIHDQPNMICLQSMFKWRAK